MTEQTESSTESPLAPNAARLHKEGSNQEISQILIARESAALRAMGGASQGVMTGVLSNLGAVPSHARDILPASGLTSRTCLIARRRASYRISTRRRTGKKEAT